MIAKGVVGASALFLSFAFAPPSAAQFDVGGSVGAYRQWLRAAARKDTHYYAKFEDYGSPGLSAAIFYRDASRSHVNLSLELLYVRRSFRVHQGYSGLAGSNSESLQADLDLLYLNVLPEVRMDDKGLAVVRFGPMVGCRLGGRASGTTYEQYAGNIQTTSFQNARPTMLKGDLRFLFGIGLRKIGSKSFGVSFDTYYNAALGSLLKGEPGSRGNDLGITIGFFRRVQCKKH